MTGKKVTITNQGKRSKVPSKALVESLLKLRATTKEKQMKCKRLHNETALCKNKAHKCQVYELPLYVQRT